MLAERVIVSLAFLAALGAAFAVIERSRASGDALGQALGWFVIVTLCIFAIISNL